MSFEISIPEDDEQLRKAFRTKVPGLKARFTQQQRMLDVMDLSATGFAILDSEKSFTEKEAVELDLMINKKLFLSGIQAMVMRVIDNGIVGLNFVELDRKKQMKLDKLVLEVQKRLIELRKKKREQG